MSSLFRHRKAASQSADNVEADAAGAGHSGSTATGDVDNLGEYAALERYISIYRDDATRKEGVLDEDDAKPKRRWWQFWKRSGAQKRSGDSGKSAVVEALLETNIHSGLRVSDVDERRKLAGWNELSAEKENHFAKFLGFFTGPILYGK